MSARPAPPTAEEIGTLVPIGRIAKDTPYSADFLRQLARSGKLRAYKLHRDWLTTPAAVHTYLKSQTKRHEKALSLLQAAEKAFLAVALLVIVLSATPQAHAQGLSNPPPSTTSAILHNLISGWQQFAAFYSQEFSAVGAKTNQALLSFGQALLGKTTEEYLADAPAPRLALAKQSIRPRDLSESAPASAASEASPQVLGISTNQSSAAPQNNQASSTTQIQTLVGQTFRTMLAQGLLTGPQGPPGPSGLTAGFSGPNGMVNNDNGKTTSVIGGTPIVSYFPPNQASGYTGGSIAGFTSLSGSSFTADNATVNSSLTVKGNTTVAGQVNAGGYMLNGAPFTGGGSSQWTTATGTSDVFYNIGNVGIGTTTPSHTLTVSGNTRITGQATIGPDESTLNPFIRGYVGHSQALIASPDTNNDTGLGVEMMSNSSSKQAIYGVIYGGGSAVEGDAYANADGQTARGIIGTAGADGNITASAAYSLLASNGFTSNGAVITNYVGLGVQDITAGTNNWAIKTGLGKVELGDTLSVTGTTTLSNLTITGTCTGCGGGGGTPGGANGQIQFNNNGAFGASADFTWDAVNGLRVQGNGTNGFASAIESELVMGGDNATAMVAYLQANANGHIATDFAGAYIDTPVLSGGSATNFYGLWVQDQTGATNNYAIKTGLGNVDFGDAVRARSTLTVGPNESMLDPLIQGYVPGVVHVTNDRNITSITQGIGVEVQNGQAVYGVSLNANDGALEGDGLTNQSGQQATGITALTRADGGVTVPSLVGFHAYGPQLTNGAAATNAIGLSIDDITGATNNYAIKTGLGLAQFGDQSLLDPVLQNYTGAKGELVAVNAANGSGVGITVSGGASPALYVASLAQRGIESDVFAAANGQSYQAMNLYTNANGFSAQNFTGLYVQSFDASGGGGAVNNYGIQIQDQTAGTNNWAIKTGSGKVEFGDGVLINVNPSVSGNPGLAIQNDGANNTAYFQTTAGGDWASGAGLLINMNANGHNLDQMNALIITPTLSGGSANVARGILVNDVPPGTLGSWAIQTGLGTVSFGDNVGIGTTTPTLGPLVMASGAYVTAGGTWTNASDRNLKENFATVTPADILQKIDGLLIQQWNYKAESATTTHIGPVAQDFYAAFHLGGNSGKSSISTIDPAGVALLGIQALDQKVTALQGSLTSNATTGRLSVYLPSNFSGDSVGEAKILTGQRSVRVTFTEPYQYQPIVTLTPEDQTASGEFVTDRDASGFSIRVPTPVTSPLNFAWHAFASAAEQLTVSDGSTAAIPLILATNPQLPAPVIAVPVVTDPAATTTPPDFSAPTTPTSGSTSSTPPAVLGASTTTPPTTAPDSAGASASAGPASASTTQN
jgi:hypothetical protein